jgi:hypothetical protein
VYTDVDHRYFNNTAVTNYSSINIQPGYQKLCDANALAFVRFRHTDNDIVRNARQQDFVRWAKDQYTESDLIANEGKLLKIFGEHTQTDRDLHTTDGLINLFNLVAFSSGHAIKQISFPAILLPCAPSAPGTAGPVAACYVGANPRAAQATYRQFMTPTTPQPSAAASPSRAPVTVGGASGPKPVPGLANDLVDGRTQAAALGHVGIPIYAPRLILARSHYCTPDNPACTVEDGQSAAQVGVSSGYPRAYTLRDQGGAPHAAYRMTLEINPLFGQYYGVQGTTWQDPPILNRPTQTKLVGGKQLVLYANGGRISLVAWHTPQGVYWVSNTLNDSIGNRQMVAIAASLTRA